MDIFQPEPRSGDGDGQLHSSSSMHSSLGKRHSHSAHSEEPKDRQISEAFDSANVQEESLLKRDGLIQTALNIVVQIGSSTVGDVLIGSLPSQPTTVSLPGFGPLTLDGFATATTTATSTTSSGTLTASTESGTTTTTTTTATSPIPTSFSGSFTTPAAITANSSILNTAGPLANSTSPFSNFTSTTAFNTTSLTLISSTFSSTLTSSSTTFSSSASSSSTTAVPGPYGGGNGPASPTSSAAPAPAQQASTSSNAGPIAGGVVGGVAGALLIGLILFLVVRRMRQKANGTRLDDGEDGQTTGPPPSRDGPNAGGMTQRSSLVPFAMFRRSQQSSVYDQEPSERGFQRVSGRRLAPVIQSGGDGYSDPMPAPRVASNLSTDFSAGSYLRDSQGGVVGGTGSTDGTASAAAPVGTAVTTAGIASSLPAPPPRSPQRPAPAARTATQPSIAAVADGTTDSDRAAAVARAERMFSGSPDSDSLDGNSSGGNNRTPSPGMTIQQGPQRTPVVARRPGDGLGRSRPSQDGSRISRFSETFS